MATPCFDRVGLSRFVKGHHNHRRAVALAESRLPDELGFAFFQRHRIDEPACLE